MSKEHQITHIERATARTRELQLCKKAADRIKKIPGRLVYVPETRTQVFVRDGKSENMVVERHKKHYHAQRVNKGFAKVTLL
jgi:hypothetical protein